MQLNSHHPLDVFVGALLGGFVLAAVVCAALGLFNIRLHELTARLSRGRTHFELLVLVGGCLSAFTWAKLGGYGGGRNAVALKRELLAREGVSKLR